MADQENTNESVKRIWLYPWKNYPDIPEIFFSSVPCTILLANDGQLFKFIKAGLIKKSNAYTLLY